MLDANIRRRLQTLDRLDQMLERLDQRVAHLEEQAATKTVNDANVTADTLDETSSPLRPYSSLPFRISDKHGLCIVDANGRVVADGSPDRVAETGWKAREDFEYLVYVSNQFLELLTRLQQVEHSLRICDQVKTDLQQDQCDDQVSWHAILKALDPQYRPDESVITYEQAATMATKLREERNRLYLDKGALQREVGELTDKLRYARGQLTELEATGDKLTRQLDEAATELDARSDTVRQLETELSKCAATLSKCTAKHQLEISQLADALPDWTPGLETHAAAVARVVAERNRLAERVKELQAEITSTVNECDYCDSYNAIHAIGRALHGDDASLRYVSGFVDDVVELIGRRAALDVECSQLRQFKQRCLELEDEQNDAVSREQDLEAYIDQLDQLAARLIREKTDDALRPLEKELIASVTRARVLLRQVNKDAEQKAPDDEASSEEPSC